MDSKTVLEKIMAMLKMEPTEPKDNTEVVEEVVTATVELEEDKKVELPVPEEEEKVEEEETKMSIEDVVAALEARIKSLEEKLAPAEVEVEVEEKKDEVTMSAEKKFTGAPVESKSQPAFEIKSEGTLSRVLARLNK